MRFSSQKWNIEKEASGVLFELSEQAIPIKYIIPIKSNGTFVLSGTYFHTKMSSSLASGKVPEFFNIAATTREVSGIIDIAVNFDHWFLKDHAMVQVGFIGPGKNKLSGDEFLVNKQTAEYVFDYNTPTLSHGFNISVDVAMAQSISNFFTIGFGGSYIYKHPYQPHERIDKDYKQGDEFLLKAGFDWGPFSPHSLRVSVDVLYAHFQKDRFGGETFYHLGDRWSTLMKASIKSNESWHEITLENRIRRSSRLIGKDLLVRNPNQWDVKYAGGVMLGEVFSIPLILKGKYVTSGQELIADVLSEVGKDLTISLGGGLRIKLSEDMAPIDIIALYKFGKASFGANEHRINGFDLLLLFGGDH